MLGIFLDTETNGLNPFVHRVLEIAFKIVERSAVTGTATRAVRGVIISPAVVSSSSRTFSIISISSSSTTPSIFPCSTAPRISSWTSSGDSSGMPARRLTSRSCRSAAARKGLTKYISPLSRTKVRGRINSPACLAQE